MNKEELIRNLKYTEKKHRNDTVNTFDTDISMMCSDVLRVLENCIEISEGATREQVFKEVFGIEMMMAGLKNMDWWNAPYKKEVEE